MPDATPPSAVPAPWCTAGDGNGYGLAAPCAGALTGGLPNGVGDWTYTASDTDKAGHTTTTKTSYRVVYGFDGFLHPINDTAHQVGTATSIFKEAPCPPSSS